MAVTFDSFGSTKPKKIPYSAADAAKVAANAPKPPTVAAAPVAPAAAPAAANYQDPSYFIDYSKIGAGYTYGSTNINNAAATDKESLSRFFAQDSQNLAQSMKQLAFQQPEDTRNATFGAHKSGLLHSGELVRTLGRIDQGYDMQREGLNTASSQARANAQAGYDSGQRQRANELAYLTSQSGPGGTDYREADAAALARALAKDQALGVKDAPPTGPNPTAAAPAAAAAAGPKPGYTNLQTVGPRAGMSYNTRTYLGRPYKFYANGDRIPA